MPAIKSYGYQVIIGDEVFKAVSSFLSENAYSSYFILCDENTLQHCLPLLVTSCPKLSAAEIIEIESGEASKSLEFSAHIWQTFIENQADKKSLLINLGGGVVSDLGGFTASVYKRGIDFINIPTSLLAMADASVGGKTGIDFNAVKNSLGTFAQPKAVFIHPAFLKTLPERHFQNGLAEVYKMALVSDKKFWDVLKESHSPEFLITKSVVLKNKIVLKDPFDKGIRKILNFGHTIGHTLEAFLQEQEQSLLHGEAILAGMIMESHISFQKKLLSKKELREIVSVFQSSFHLRKIEGVPFRSIIDLVKNDKKTAGNKFRFSLIAKIGTGKYDVEVNESQVKKATDYYNTLTK
jgi:3-dehydroquinate synthase